MGGKSCERSVSSRYCRFAHRTLQSFDLLAISSFFFFVMLFQEQRNSWVQNACFKNRNIRLQRWEMTKRITFFVYVWIWGLSWSIRWPSVEMVNALVSRRSSVVRIMPEGPWSPRCIKRVPCSSSSRKRRGSPTYSWPHHSLTSQWSYSRDGVKR